MKILLTGPCGRVGVFAFERLLEKGYQVRGFDIKDFMSFPIPEGVVSVQEEEVV